MIHLVICTQRPEAKLVPATTKAQLNGRVALRVNDVPDDVPLGKFVRSLTGLSEEAAHAVFSEFLDTGLYSEAQIHFVKCVMDWIITNGTLERTDMSSPEFCGGDDIVEIFEDNIVVLIGFLLLLKALMQTPYSRLLD